MKVVKSAQHYTETAIDEIKLLRCVSGLVLELITSNIACLSGSLACNRDRKTDAAVIWTCPFFVEPICGELD